MNFLLRASRAILLAVALMSFAVSVAPVHAAPGVRANVTYQARLMDASGYPVADGVYQVEFSLYDAPVAGTRLWTADGTVGAPLPVNVTVQDGLFTVLLGDGVTQLHTSMGSETDDVAGIRFFHRFTALRHKGHHAGGA